MSNNKDFKVKNGVVANGYLENVGSVTTVANAGGPLFSGMTYSGESFSVSSQNNSPRDVVFNNDGTKMYMCGYTGDVIYQYSLTTGFDLSTASYDSVSFDTTSTALGPFSVAFNTTGSKMFVLRYNGPASVYQYSLSTSFDLSTASYDNVNFSVAAENYVAYDITFNNDGTKMYMVGATGDFVYQYTLSTGFSISTASYDSVSFSVSSQDTLPNSIAFNSDGSKMYIVGDTTNSVYEYILTTSFDISTASYTGVSFSFGNQDAGPSGIVFNNDDSKLFMIGFSSDAIHEYSIPLLDNKTLDLSTGTVFDVSITEPVKISLTNAPAGSSKTLSTLFLTQEGIGSFILSDANPEVDAVFINPVGINYAYRGLTFKSDGTKMYVSAYNSTFIWQYSLSSPWSVASAIYESASPSGLSGVSGITFSADGTKVYGVDYSPDMIYEYNLSTAWDISTLVYNSVTFEPGGSPWHITFKPDGTKMYVTDAGVVKQYTLSTAWDLSTASYDSKSLSVSSIYSCYLNSDGTKIFVMNISGLVSEYTLSTAYDVSTASFVTSATFFTNSGYSATFSLFFKPDGTSSYTIVGQDYVVQYANKETNTVVFDDSITLASTGTPSIFSTDIIGFETTDAGSTFTGTKFIGGLK